MPITTTGYAAQTATSPLAPWTFTVRDVGPTDIHIKVKYCGVCHSDIHQARDEWGSSIFPMVPGHEITGIVEAVGPQVTKFKKGDRAGVGCMVGSCRSCDQCKSGLECYCNGMIPTYNSNNPEQSPTYGGYARDVVVEERFVVKIPDDLELSAAAPLLCAGITSYSPMKYCGLDKPGHKIAVLGLGGLGHMAVKLGAAWGNEVTVLSRSLSKLESAKKLGAAKFIDTTDASQMQSAVESLDFIIDTVSAPKDFDMYMNLLKVGGGLITVGLPPAGEQIKVSPFTLIAKRRRIIGSLIGGLPETQEMLDFCAKKECPSNVEIISMAKVNEAYERVLKSDVKYRFVIDVEGTCP